MMKHSKNQKLPLIQIKQIVIKKEQLQNSLANSQTI